MNEIRELIRDPGTIRNFVGGALRIAVIVALTVVVVRLTRKLMERFARRLESEDTQAGRNLQRSRTLTAVARSVVSTVVWTFAVLLILQQVGVNLGPLLAGAGIVGVAVGFGAQSLVRDFLTGFFVLLEDQYQVGDIIEINGVSGKVENFTLRRTALRALDGTLHHVANGQIQQVSNMSAGWSVAVLDIGVAYNADLDAVRRALTQAGDSIMTDPDVGRWVLEQPEILGVEDFGESQVTVRVTAKTMPGRQVPVSRAFRQRIKEAFDREGISIPFPHRVMIHQSAPDGVRPAPVPGGGDETAGEDSDQPVGDEADD